MILDHQLRPHPIPLIKSVPPAPKVNKAKELIYLLMSIDDANHKMKLQNPMQIDEQNGSINFHLFEQGRLA
jgi:hypothetical protein